MARTVFDKWADNEPAPEGASFLERALERALANLDIDATLTAAQRMAAKSALAAALTSEISAVLRRPRPPGPAASRAFPERPRGAKPGYFREPSLAIGRAEGKDGDGLDVRLTGGTATWLRVMPARDPGRVWTCAAIRAAMRKPGMAVRPIFADARGIGQVRAEDGFGIYATSPSATESSGVVFGFRTGEVWSVDTYVQDALSEQQPNRAIMTLQPQLTAAFESYVGLLERLGAPKPYRWVIGMDGLLGRSIALPQEEMAGLLRGDCVVNTVEVSGAYDGAQSIEAAIQPFFDDLYRACSTPVG